MNLTQIKRLENLIIATKEAPRASFDMNAFIHDDKNEPELCGTPACVFGNYVARRDLQRAFKFNLRTVPAYKYDKMTGYPVRDTAGKMVVDDVNSHTDYEIVNADGELSGPFGREGMEHFGLEFDEIYQLFDCDGCGGAGRDVAAAVRFLTKFVNAKKRQFAKERGFRSWKVYQESKQAR
jgi:hypothetical protein